MSGDGEAVPGFVLQIGCEVESVNGHGAIGAGVGKSGMGEIADDEPGPVGQPAKVCHLAGETGVIPVRLEY